MTLLGILKCSTDELFVLLVFLASLVVRFLWNVGVALAEGSACDRGHAIDKLGLKEDVGVREHAILQGHHYKLRGENLNAINLHLRASSTIACPCLAYLRVSKMGAQHLPNVLCVGQIQGSVNLIKDVYGGGFEQKHGQDERQSYQ